MLIELEKVNQDDDGFRRIFVDDYFDLFVWYDLMGEKLLGFELCYDKTGYERSIIWRVNQGYLHSKVDSGEVNTGRAKQTPILLTDGVFERITIANKFRKNSKEMEPELADFIYKKLLETKI